MKLFNPDDSLTLKTKFELYSNKAHIGIPIIFFENRLEAEFNNLTRNLKEIIAYAAAYMANNFQSPLVLTHVFRTQEDQDRIYKDDPMYKVKKFQSVHQFYRGADVRISDIGMVNAHKLADHI